MPLHVTLTAIQLRDCNLKKVIIDQLSFLEDRTRGRIFVLEHVSMDSSRILGVRGGYGIDRRDWRKIKPAKLAKQKIGDVGIGKFGYFRTCEAKF